MHIFINMHEHKSIHIGVSFSVLNQQNIHEVFLSLNTEHAFIRTAESGHIRSSNNNVRVCPHSSDELNARTMCRGLSCLILPYQNPHGLL